MIHFLFGYVISINKQTAVGKKQKNEIYKHKKKRIIIKRGAINSKQTH